ncbi:hypothetical protein LRP88_04362 [Fusarium phalaenopsidis]
MGDTGKKFVVRMTNNFRDEEHPYRVIWDLKCMGAGQREVKCPDQEAAATLVITGSPEYEHGFVTSIRFGRGDWMHMIHDTIKDCKLKEVIVPGSHDAGMSYLSGKFHGDDYIGVFVSGETDWNLLSAEAYAMAIGLNLYAMSENCGVNPDKRPPLLPKESKRQRLASGKQRPQRNGIVYANGTVDDNPPADLHLGYIETLKKGTIFGNGTILEKAMPNPNCNTKGPPKIYTLPSFGISESTLSTSVTTLSTPVPTLSAFASALRTAARIASTTSSVFATPTGRA